MNSDITKLYVEGVQQRHRHKDDAKWQSMQEKYLVEILEESNHDGITHKLISVETGEEVDEARLSEGQLEKVRRIFKTADKKSNKSLVEQIKELINNTGFGAGAKAKGNRALLHTLHYIFGVDITNHEYSHNLLERMISRARSSKINMRGLVNSEQPFELTETIYNNENFSGMVQYKEILGWLYMAKPTKQPNVGDGEFMLCCFFDVKQNTGTAEADLITDDGSYSIEVKGKEARMGSGSDDYAFTVLQKRTFLNKINEGGGEGIKRIATQQKYQGKIKGMTGEPSKIITQLAKINPPELDRLWSADATTHQTVTDTLQSIQDTLQNIQSSVFSDTFTSDLQNHTDILSQFEWKTMGATIKTRQELPPTIVTAAAGSVPAVNKIIGALNTLIPLLSQIHNYEIASKLKYTAAFYGQQIQAWVNWISDEAKSDVARFSQEKLEEMFIEGMLDTRNWKQFKKDSPAALADLKSELTPICKELLSGCFSGKCELDAGKNDVPSGKIEALVGAIHVWCYHREKQFNSILFISENKFQADSPGTAEFHSIGLDFQKGGKDLPGIYNFFLNNEFKISLDIDSSRKDGVKVNFLGPGGGVADEEL